MAMKSLLFTENGASQNADEARLLVRGLLGAAVGSATGVVTSDHLKVTQRAAGVNMSVDVAVGHMFVEGQRSTAQGVYHLYNDAVANVVLSAADPTNPRIDVIYVRVRDSAYDGAFAGQDDSPILVAQGTAAGSPVAPTPSGTDFVVLARVAVAAGATTIVNANITDLRTVLRGPWNTAWGRVAMAEITATAGAGTTSPVDVSGLSVTFTAIAGRRYRVGAVGATKLASGAASHASHSLYILQGSTNIQWSIGAPGGADFVPHSPTRDITFTPGSVTVKVQIARNGGSGNVEVYASTDLRAQLWVDDIGPA